MEQRSGQSSRAATELQLAYGVFQGGGARGFAHIGALRAAEELGFRFYGFAGTSAGAVVAALASVGYKADEIFDTANPTKHLLARVAAERSDWQYRSPIDVLGHKDWKGFHQLRSAVHKCSDKRDWRRPLHFSKLIPGLVSGYRRLNRQRGWFQTAEIVKVVNELLYDQLTRNYSAYERASGQRLPKTFGKLIRFCDVSRSVPNCTTLKIIATDLARNRLVVFSSHDTPDVSIAQAVAASAAVPFVFEPVHVRWPDGDEGRIYVDGGLASNLPIWAFRDEKAADERRLGGRLPTLGFAFQENDVRQHARQWNFSLRELSGRVTTAGLSTGQSVVRDFIEDLEMIALPCDLSMFDFDADLGKICRAVDTAHKFTKDRLTFRFVTRPKKVKYLLEKLQKNALARFESDGLPRTAMRLAAIEPVRTRYRRARPLHFRVAETYGFNGDADDRLLLDGSNRAAPRAFALKGPTVWPPEDASTEPYVFLDSEPMTKYERALVRRGLRSILSLPVFADPSEWAKPTTDRSDAIGVVTIDSDQDCRNLFRTQTFLDFVVPQTGGLTEIFLRSEDGKLWED
jgi:predicted acylesterase/phospholipase RssA